MCNRIHFVKVSEAESVRTLLVMRGYFAHTVSNGCMYDGGVILEVGDSAFEFALQICDAFSIVATIEG